MVRKRIFSIISVALLVAISVISLFFAFPALTEKEQAEAEGVTDIIRVWHIDTFEGGKGSRASFLSNATRRFERNKTYLFMVVSHTVMSAATALESGETPDMLSFGTGGAVCPELFLPLEKYDFNYSRQDGKTLAVPWCRGAYFCFTLEGDFSDMTPDNTVISEGNYSMAQVASVCENIPGGKVQNSVSAYVDLLNGKYKYMLGTQRDIARFNTRGVQFACRPVNSFSDLYQYIAILTDNAHKYNIALDFISFLLSEERQKELTGIGMLSQYYSVYDDGNAAMQEAERVTPLKGVSAFTDENAYSEMRALAARSLSGDGDSLKKLKNFLV